MISGIIVFITECNLYNASEINNLLILDALKIAIREISQLAIAKRVLLRNFNMT